MKATYEVIIGTGDVFFAGTKDIISVMLVGTLGCSKKVWIGNWVPIRRGETHCMQLKTTSDLGDILLVKLFKDTYLFGEDDWYCSYVQVKTTNKISYDFPCFSWITDSTPLEIIEGTARKRHEYTSPTLEEYWMKEMQKRQEEYQWASYAPGIPNKIHYDDVEDLPRDAKIPLERPVGLLLSIQEAITQQGVHEEERSQAQFQRTYISSVKDFVTKHWHEDKLFAYQFLNGSNPNHIKQCKKIPANFPVTEQMVGPFLGPKTNLQQEVQKGNIYLVDYEMLDGIKANSAAGHQYLGAPMCLLYVNPMNDLLPIAIQITQHPGPDCPIFLPSDSEYDWLLAKMWVRNADVQVHQLVSHLLRTHLFGEIFGIATLRQLASAHPIFKLLMPHVKYTLHINMAARNLLISKDGVFDKAFSSGGPATVEVLQRGLDRTTYESMCLPDNLAARGVEKIPNYYYRDDALKNWLAINKFTENIVDLYYENDTNVQCDPELQAWVKEIFVEGLLSKKSSGFPSSFHSKAELIKYLTMVIFTCSGQHSAVNVGQYDWGSCVQNSPSIMGKPAPTKKGLVTKADIAETLPKGIEKATVIATTYLLSQPSPINTKLGTYVEERFTELEARAHITDFVEAMLKIEEEITKRNSGLPLAYTYLLPSLIDNSVAV
ncbi:polyunsaturated fatty acid 5-lipoxygenase-like [Leucoraja erinacea]|uniref:polyunsaturated fatty acid 5-lipoxygenase-like n=1 Tax=Leucoraja erinaceus TaxID=7782 RepID=UPI002457FA34|nr:polyunsaturated fatty acid 5-lipoxygenase-like [Leucoraja erinacea]